MLIDGKQIAKQIQSEMQLQLSEYLQKSKRRAPSLAVILVGDNPASKIYVRRKREACSEVGISSLLFQLESSTPQEILLQKVHQLNEDEQIDGILVQFPLPGHIETKMIAAAIAPEKDVDGSSPVNMGKLLMGDPTGFVPCTPLGIQQLLLRSDVSTEGKHVVIIGRSNLVGKPMAAILMQNAPGANATVTLLHSHSKNVEELCSSADILIAAVGRPGLILPEHVKEGAVVIDVGINKVPSTTEGKEYDLVGDVAFEAVADKCSLITPVPGGVGPMTIAMLLANTLKSFGL